jgi:hypothetical protein
MQPIWAQREQASKKNAPVWVYEPIQSKSGNYKYLKLCSQGSNLDSLRKQLMQEYVVSEAAFISEITVESMSKRKIKVLNNGESYEFSDSSSLHHKPIALQGIQRVDEFYQQTASLVKPYEYCGLYRHTSDNLKDPKPGSIIVDYRRAPIWKSILPGWPQFGNKQRTKGYLLLAGFLASSVTAGYSQLVIEDELQKMRQTIGTSDHDIHKQNYDNFSSLRNGALVALGAVYLYTIIDASSFREEPIYAYIPEGLKFYPIFSLTEQGLGLAYQF